MAVYPEKPNLKKPKREKGGGEGKAEERREEETAKAV